MNYEEIQKENIRKEIIEFVEQIENQRYLEFIYELLKSFRKKWGI